MKGARASAPPLPGGAAGGLLYPTTDLLPSALEEPPLAAAPLLPPQRFGGGPDSYALLGAAGGGGGGFAGGGFAGGGGGTYAAPPQQQQQQTSYNDAAADYAFAADMAVASASVRSRFVSKVFGLLTVQLALVALLALSLGAAAPRLASSPALLAGSAAASLSLVLVLSCSERARRAHPLNLALLCLFSGAQGVLLAAATAGMQSRVVLDAVLVTAAAVGALCCYGLASAHRQRDFHATDGMLLTALVCFSAVLLARALLPARLCPPTLDLLISACGALLFASYVAFDVQLLARGDHRCAVGGPDDYVLAVLTIEVDVINLFSYVLELMQAVEGDDR